MKRPIHTLLLLVVFTSINTVLSARTWTRIDGETAEGEIIGKTDEKITLRMPDGREVDVLLSLIHI